MERNFTDYVRNLHDLFENGFAEAYRDANARKRRQLMPYIGALHRRWYYSNLIENTIFSPANIMDSMAGHFGKGEVHPNISLRSAAKFAGFEVTMTAYDTAHPIIADLRVITDFCLPHADICDGDFFFEKQLLQLTGKLSICDPAYPSFLLDLALKMKLVTKLPSLYVNRIEPARDWEARLAGEPTSLFGEIVNAAVAVCAYHMRELIALPEVLFTDGYVRAMLTEPVETDAVFEQVYDSIGYTLDDLVEFAEKAGEMDFDTEEGAFLAGTFMMGIVLDQHFFTPFGYYLKLIKPMYVLPFEFDNEIDEFLDGASFDKDEVYIAFFAPCSSYTLTELGLRTLKVKRTEANFFDVAKHLPFESFKDTLFGNPEMVEVLIQMAKMFPPLAGEFAPPEKIYAFRVSMADDPAMWLDLHMPADASLDDFYEEICEYFPLRDSEDYSFFHSPVETPFAEYPSPKRAKKNAKKSTAAKLDSLDFEREKQMLLAVHGQALPFSGASPVVRLELEMRGTEAVAKERDYPWAGRISKVLKEHIEATWEDEG